MLENDFVPPSDANYSVAVDSSQKLANPSAAELLSANPELGKSADIDQNASEIETLKGGVAALQGALSDMSSGKAAFTAIKFALFQNGSPLPGQYGYMVLEIDSDGYISPLYLTQEEFYELNA